MRLELAEERRARIERVLQVAVIVAAVATMPLTYAHTQEMNGWWLYAADWIVWGVFLAELAFFLAITDSRIATLKEQKFNTFIVVASFPLLPHLLGLTRLARLMRPLRLLGGFRVARPFQLARLYAMRSMGSKYAKEQLQQTDTGRRVFDEVTEKKDEVTSRIPGNGDDGEGRAEGDDGREREAAGSRRGRGDAEGDG